MRRTRGHVHVCKEVCVFVCLSVRMIAYCFNVYMAFLARTKARAHHITPPGKLSGWFLVRMYHIFRFWFIHLKTLFLFRNFSDKNENIEFEYLDDYRFLGLICNLFDDTSHHMVVYGDMKTNYYKNIISIL